MDGHEAAGALPMLMLCAGLLLGFLAGLRVRPRPRPPEPRGHLTLTLGPVYERPHQKGAPE